MSQEGSRGSRSRTQAAATSLEMLAEAETLRMKARRLEIDAKIHGENLTEEDFQSAREIIVGVKANSKHKEAAFNWLQECSKRTQLEARKLLEKGTLPGLERVKVMISQSSFSKFCGKMDSGLTTKEGKGRPQILSEET